MSPLDQLNLPFFIIFFPNLKAVNFPCCQSERLHKVLNFVCTIHDLSAILGMDFASTISEVHPSLNDSVGMESKSISNGTLSKLARTVLALREDKKLRLQKVIVVHFCICILFFFSERKYFPPLNVFLCFYFIISGDILSGF